MKEDLKVFAASFVTLASLMFTWVVIAGPAPASLSPPSHTPAPIVTNSVMWTNRITGLLLSTNTCWSIPDSYRKEVEDYWKNGTSNFPTTEVVNYITNYIGAESLFSFYAVTNLMCSDTNFYLPFQFKSAEDVFEYVRTNKIAWSNYEASVKE